MEPIFNLKIFHPFRESRLFTGFSGGADSTAALLLALQNDLQVTAVHFAHGLRGEESEAEARSAEKFCREREIPFLRIDLKLPEFTEEAARDARLTEWKRLTAERNSAVILGHHADDAVETMLLRLARGSNVSGLAAMRPVSVVEGVTFLRPLLEWRRSDVERYLREQGIESWAEDSSNGDGRYTRNFLRNTLLPEFHRAVPGSETGLLRSLAPLTEDAEYLEEEAARRFDEIASLEETPLTFWRELPPPIQVRVLRLYLNSAFGRDVVPTRTLIERFREMIGRNLRTSCQLPLGGGEYLHVFPHYFTAYRVSPPPPEAENWAWQETSVFEWAGFRLHAEFVKQLEQPTLLEAFFDADALPARLLVDYRRDGDRMRPFGYTLDVRLKHLRIDRKVPPGALNLVLRAEGTILWAPGIRHSDHAKVTENTRKIVRFRLESSR